MSIIISVHWFPIIVGAGLAFALGMAWYHPSVFGTKWMAEQPHRKFPDAYQTGMKAGMIASLIDAVLVATLVKALFSILYYPGCNSAWAVYSGRHLCRWRFSGQNPQNLDD